MQQGKFIIRSNREIADRTFLLEVEGNCSATQRAGQFADIAIDGFFLRRPLAVLQWDATKMSLVYKVVGEGTKKLAAMTPGEQLDILTGLGNGFDTSLCHTKALIVCGGIGASPAFSLAKQLRERGIEVNVILGFNKASEIILEKEYKALGCKVAVTTVDGSAGIKGFVTGALGTMAPGCECFYTCGPKIMMKAVCGALDIPGEASLEERMGCGCGICYGCTCHTSEGPKRVCADGPVFKKEDIVW